MYHCSKLEKHVLLHRIHFGPVLDVRAVAELFLCVLFFIAVEYATLVNLGIELVRLVVVVEFNVSRARW